MLLNGLPNSCKNCPLATNKHPGYFTKVTGSGSTGVMIIGEASGEHEAAEARPFIEWAASGSILEKCIRNSGLSRENFWLTNIIRCRPPNNLLLGASYEREAIDHCSSYLESAIAKYNPRAILSLGSIPLRELTGMAGKKQGITYLRGFPLASRYGITVIPSYHPAYITRGNTSLIPLLMKDIASARSAAAGRLTPVIRPQELMEALEGTEAFEMLYSQALANPDLWIAYDIETQRSLEGVEDDIVEFEYTDEPGDCNDRRSERSSPDDVSEMVPGETDHNWIRRLPNIENGSISNNLLGILPDGIVSIQFAISDDWGVYGNWADPRIRDLAQRILALPNPKVAHNGDHFDKPKLELEGVRILGNHYDSLSIRKSLQPDLPAGLQQVAVDYGWLWPWKHYSGSDDLLYGVADVCSLIRIIYKLPHELVNLGMWDGYEKYIRRHRAIVEEPWERRGIPIDITRLNELRDWLAREVLIKTIDIKSHIPDELHAKHPEEGYKNVPDSIKSMILEDEKAGDLLTKPTEKVLKNGTIKLIKSKVKVSDIYKMLMNMKLPELLNKVLMAHPELQIGDFNGTTRLFERVWFNPRSSKQMIEYVKFKGYEVPKDFKTGADSTADKLMKRLEIKYNDPVISLSRSIRAFEKMRDSYTGKMGSDGVALGGWIPDDDGRLRTRAMTNKTWQFSSRKPNVFTLPKRREELADKFRRVIAAEPGHVIVTFDFKAFHDLTTAALATDERKWRTARIDPHAYVAGWLVKYPDIEKALELSDSDLKLYLKELRSKHEKVRDEQAKPLNHGINFGEGYRRLYSENEEYFESEAQAKQMHEMMRRVYPKTFQWQAELLESLEIKGGKAPYLQSVWGARRWFWDVWAWKKTKDGRWYKAKGQDAEAAIAFLPANHAHGMFRKKMLQMAEIDDLLDRYELINFPHDELVFHPLIELADECIANVKGIMELPVIELANPILCPDGLSCAVDVKIGPDLGSMSELTFK